MDATPFKRCSESKKFSIVSANSFIVGVSKGAAISISCLTRTLLKKNSVPKSEEIATTKKLSRDDTG